MENCCEINDTEICDNLESIPFQYRNSKNILTFLSSFLSQANKIKSLYRYSCSSNEILCGGILRDIQDFELGDSTRKTRIGAGSNDYGAGTTDYGAGEPKYMSIYGEEDSLQYTEELTRYGSIIGFPRTQCNVRCGDSGPYTIEDNILYCKFLSVYLLANQGPSISNLQIALEILFGPEAFIISSKDGITKVSTGRPLEPEELNIIELYRRYLPHTPATKIEIYDIGSLSELVGFNCGDCNNYEGFCSTASPLCGEIECQ